MRSRGTGKGCIREIVGYRETVRPEETDQRGLGGRIGPSVRVAGRGGFLLAAQVIQRQVTAAGSRQVEEDEAEQHR